MPRAALRLAAGLCLLLASAAAASRGRGRADSARGRQDARPADVAGNPEPAQDLSPHELLLRKLSDAGAHADHARHPPSKAHKDSPADQLAKLAALNSEGIIDNDQYRKAKAKVMAELHKQREAEAGAAPGQKARGRGSEGPAPARDEGEREREEEERRKEAREGSGHKSEEQQEREERARESAAGTVHPSEEQREASLVDTAKAAKKAQSAAAAAAGGTNTAAKTGTKHPHKAPVHKLMDREEQEDTSEAGILDRFHEYTDEDEANAPPGQQGGEKLDPQQKSFFTDVQHEAYKSDAVKEFPKDMLAAMDLGVKPCDDFYEFACGTFLKEAVIPDYLTASTLTWDTAKKSVIEETNNLLMEDAGEAGTFYRSCVDQDAVEAAGATPLTAWFQAIAGVADMESLSSFLATAGTYNWCGFFCWHVSLNALDQSKNRMVLSHVSLTMPDQKYYVDEGADMDEHREAMQQAAEDLLFAAGAPSKEEAKRQAAIALAIESDVAKSMVTKERMRNIHPVKVSRDRLKEISPSVNWDVFFEGMGMPDVGNGAAEEEGGDQDNDNLFVHDFHYLENLEENVWSKYTFDDLRIYLILRMVNVYTPYLASSFSDAKMVLNDDLYGMTEKSPRARKCYFLTVRQFKESVGKLFVDTYFPDVAEAAAEQMLGDIRSAFEGHLETLKWMDSQTRESAVEKLEGMDYQVGYPEGWPMLAKYGTLTLSGSLYENIVTIAQAHSKQERDRLYEAPLNEKWNHAATTINAYYSRNKNALFIPAGILQPPFFSPEFPDCRNYGGIGSVLGHEMTHGFDDSGRKYDATGKRSNWWDPETEAYFEERAACLVNQFDDFTVSGGKHVNGNLTLGENIADGGGLRMSFKAFLERHPQASKWEKQMFFLSYAQIWCGVQRPKAAQAHVLKGVHSPKRYRVVGTLRDSPEFSEAYGCKAGDPMNPEDKCIVW